jgi:hypothetical protein
MYKRRPVDTEAQERRQREDAAPRLRDRVPELTTLSIEVNEGAGKGLATTRYVKHVVVSHAPALFELPCSEPDCESGGHDVTTEILAALKAGKKTFAGQHSCRGNRRGQACDRILAFDARAQYA